MTAAQANSGEFDLPSLFEANEGQFADGVRFGMQSGGFTVLLRDSSATLELEGQDVTLDLARAAPTTHVVGADPLATKINYLVGPRSEWATNVSTYGAARYVGVYPGIAALFHARADGFQYDFELAPGADPSQIGLRVGGAEAVSIARSGDLIVGTENGELRQSKPFAYQVIDGSVVEVPSAFTLRDNLVGFQLGDYDSSLPLVIDPSVEYSTYLGGSREERLGGFEVDAEGNAYIFGHTDSSEPRDDAPEGCSESPVPTTDGAFQEEAPTSTASQTQQCEDSSNSQNENTFVAKFDPSGDAVFVTYLGGSDEDSAPGLPGRDLLGVDVTGNAVVAGTTGSGDFPLENEYDDTCFDGSACPTTASDGDDGDAFVTKFTADGTDVIYSTYLGGSEDEGAFGVDVDPEGNAYIVGQTSSVDFPTATATDQNAYGGGEDDVFVTKFDTDGDPVYATYLGGGAGEHGMDISHDPAGNAYVVGRARSTNFPLENEYDATHGGDLYAGFLTTYDEDGDRQFSTYLSGSVCVGSQDIGDCDTKADHVASPTTGLVHVAGVTRHTDFPTTDGGSGGVYDETCAGASPEDQDEGGDEPQPDAFLAHFGLDGEVGHVTCFGGNNFEEVEGLAVSEDGNAYITGWTTSHPSDTAAGFPLVNAFDDDPSVDDSEADPPTDTAQMAPEAYVAGFTDDGSDLDFSTYLGGEGPEFGRAITLTDDGDVFVTGVTVQRGFAQDCCWTVTDPGDDPNFPTTNDSLPEGDQGDAYVSGFEPNGDVVYSSYLGGSGPQEGNYIGADDEDVIVAGHLGPSREGSDDEWGGDPIDTNAPNFPLQNAYDSDLEESHEISDDNTDRQNDEAFVTRLSSGGGGGGGGGTDVGDLDISPEREENTLPQEDDHALSAEVTGDEGDPIDFKIVAGPNGNTAPTADFSCDPDEESGECEADYTSGGQTGLDHICGWVDADNDNEYDVNGSDADGGECEEENVDAEENNDSTDVVFKNWVGTDAPKPACSDMEDNDDDDLVDDADPDCEGPDDDSEGPGQERPACDDGRDNDRDGKTDAADPNCTGPNDDSEGPRRNPPAPEDCDVDKFPNFNVVLGTEGPDTLRGTPGRDLICANSGADRIFGRGGNDVIFAGSGADVVAAGRGADLVRSGGGPDKVEGDRGGDEIHGGDKGDRLKGNDGKDSLYGHDGRDRLKGGPDDDDLHGGPGSDNCSGGGGTDSQEGCES